MKSHILLYYLPSRFLIQVYIYISGEVHKKGQIIFFYQFLLIIFELSYCIIFMYGLQKLSEYVNSYLQKLIKKIVNLIGQFCFKVVLILLVRYKLSVLNYCLLCYFNTTILLIKQIITISISGNHQYHTRSKDTINGDTPNFGKMILRIVKSKNCFFNLTFF